VIVELDRYDDTGTPKAAVTSNSSDMPRARSSANLA
jgi:hypothetical protein